jgi:CDP-ribitol ribitolphosphotransferase
MRSEPIFSNKRLVVIFVELARGIYMILKLLPTKDKVVFISRNSRETSLDFRLLVNEISKSKNDLKIVILNHRMSNKFRHMIDILIEMYHLATSKSCVIDSYVIAVSILKHKNTLKIIQIWHGLGTVKKFGYNTLDKKAGSPSWLAQLMNMHRNYSYVCCGSKAMAPVFATSFNVPKNIIMPIGMPRVDYLLDKKQQTKNRQKILEKYPNLCGKKVILYAPTFRKRDKIRAQELIDEIDFSEYALIIKQHRLDKTKYQQNQNTIIFKDNYDIVELLPSAHYVITDYSAVVFEAALLSKPIFFWDYDFEKYEDSCGFSFDYKSTMPGIISPSASKIIEAIKQNDYSLAQIKDFARKFVDVRDGTCTKRIKELICE